MAAMPIARVASAEPSASNSGRFENSALWLVAGELPRAVEALGKDLLIDGWIFFGSDRIGEMFGDTSHRNESLPAYIQGIAVARGAKTTRLNGYARIPVPGESEAHQGTLMLIGVEGEEEIVSVRIGAGVPSSVRVVVLVDNLGADLGYASRRMRLCVNGTQGAPADLSPDGQPDWILWDLSGLK
jgi:hypothetical protein